jgi:hypothetical protein
MARGPGDWVGNGASFAENLVLLAFQNLEFYLNACIREESCLNEIKLLDPNQPDTIQNIFLSLREERKLNPEMIRFAPMSRLFEIDGEVKVAVTGLHKGDIIYINKDLLYEFDPNNKLKTITLLQIVSILIHELGHHQGITNHNYLDRIGAIVANQTRFESQFINLHPKINNLGAQFSSPRSSNISPSKLALIDEEKYLDLTAIINSIAQCPKINSETTYVKVINLWNVYWQNPMSTRAKLIAYLALKCQKQNGEYFEWVGDKLIISPVIEQTTIGFRFLPNNLGAFIEPCSRVNGECETLLLNFNEKQRANKP